MNQPHQYTIIINHNYLSVLCMLPGCILLVASRVVPMHILAAMEQWLSVWSFVMDKYNHPLYLHERLFEKTPDYDCRSGLLALLVVK